MGVTTEERATRPVQGSNRPNCSLDLIVEAQMAMDSHQPPNRWTHEIQEQAGHQRPDEELGETGPGSG